MLEKTEKKRYKKKEFFDFYNSFKETFYQIKSIST